MSKPLFSILHIPKCAGTSLERHFESHLSSDRFLRLPQRKHVRAVRKHPPTPEQARELEVFTGHFITRTLEEQLGVGREIRRAVLLMDPLSLFLSHYNYRMMRYLASGQRTYPVAVELRSRAPNYVTNFILRNYLERPWWRRIAHSESAQYDVMNQLLSGFWFVADYRRCNDLVALVAHACDIPSDMERHNTQTQWRQKTTSFTPLRAEDLDPELVAEFRARNRVDAEIYRLWGQAGLDAHKIRAPGLDRPKQPSAEWTLLTRGFYQLRRRWLRGR